MRRYASSKFRITLLALLMTVAAVTLLWPASSEVLAQPAPAAPATGAPAGTDSAAQSGSLIRLIFSHLDPVFFTIAALSVAGLTLIIQGFLQNRASVFMPESTTNQIREMIAQRRFKELIDFTETDNSFVSRSLNPALKRAPSFSSMKEAMETAIGEQTAEQFRKIEYLNIIGNLGPLLGLLGTVLGMIYAFQEVASSGGQADVGKLSFGISTALTHTFLGLFLAVPCLAAFGVLRTIVDRLTVRGALVSEELLLMIKPQESRGAPPGSGVSSALSGSVAGMRVPGTAVPQPMVGNVRKPASPLPQ